MGKKSVVVSGGGLFLGMIINANQIRKEMGVSDEQFHLLASEAGREHWQRLFEGMVNKNRYEIKTVTIKSDETLDKMIAAGQYDSVNSNITAERFPIVKSRQEDIEITLVHRNKNEQSQRLIDEMDAEGYRPATHEEQLALGAQHKELQRKFPIIALGTVVRVGDVRRVLCLYEWNGERKLGLDWFDDECSRDCHFAFVRKSSDD